LAPGMVHHFSHVTTALFQRQEINPSKFLSKGADMELVLEALQVAQNLGCEPLRRDLDFGHSSLLSSLIPKSAGPGCGTESLPTHGPRQCGPNRRDRRWCGPLSECGHR